MLSLLYDILPSNGLCFRPIGLWGYLCDLLLFALSTCNGYSLLWCLSNHMFCVFSSLKETEIDRHPERRLKAAFAAFEEANMPRIKAENHTLRLSQLKQILRKEWMKSPENPLNQRLLWSLTGIFIYNLVFFFYYFPQSITRLPFTKSVCYTWLYSVNLIWIFKILCSGLLLYLTEWSVFVSEISDLILFVI